MNDNRNKIDMIDEKIMELLEERFTIVDAVGIDKQIKNLPIYDQNREEAILKKADSYLHEQAIKQVYQTIMQVSKDNQQISYGLVGKSLPHTLSPFIYKELGLLHYGIVETDDFTAFANTSKLKGFNITNPYKKTAFDWCKTKSEEAIRTNAVNCIIDNKGYNLDFLAIQSIIKTKNYPTRKWKTLIIGNGATALSMAVAFGGSIVYLVRNKKNDKEYFIEEYTQFLDADCIINTTPYGTYPQLEKDPLFPLNAFTNLKLVWDVVYNPLFSPLVKEGMKNKIPVINGLSLLIQQAIYSYQLYTNTIVDVPYQKMGMIKRKLFNIVLIGLSFSGKSTLAKRLSFLFQKRWIDFDAILASQKKDLKSVLQHGTITSYRQMEVDLAKQYGNRFSQIIAPGGGIVLSEEAMLSLKSNAVIVFLDIPIATLIKRMDDTRPLIRNKTDLEQMAEKRRPFYQKYQDITLTGEEDEKEVVKKIETYMDNQWA
ncbi:MAG: shikimate kinase [Bacilli bacterium]|nr:shikimate kinase [Bacilli bacterium]